MRVGFYHASSVQTAHVDLAAQLIRSVRRTMPDAEIVHFTDEVTRAIVGVDRVLRLGGGPVALACVDAYAAAGPGDWLFVDTDVVVRQDVRDVWAQAFDIAVADRAGTMKPHEPGSKFMALHPYNKGAVFSRSPAFWRAAAARLRTMPDYRQRWMGDQLAMNEEIASGQWSVAVLPNRYNYPPRTPEEDVSDKAIVHFKGSRKKWVLGRVA